MKKNALKILFIIIILVFLGRFSYNVYSQSISGTDELIKKFFEISRDFDIENYSSEELLNLVKEITPSDEESRKLRQELLNRYGFDIMNIDDIEEIKRQIEIGDFFIDILPKNPSPNTDVKASLRSYSFDIDRSTITWFLNGKKILSGVGEKYFDFKNGDVGTKIVLTVEVVNPKGYKLSKTLNFNAADVDILWEAETYTPEVYKGKALPSSESMIKFTAIPNFIDSNGKKIPPSKLIYNWQINFNNILSASGYGRQSFSYKISKINKSDNVKVTISDYNKKIITEKMIEINSIWPKIVLYKESPLEGVQYNKAVNEENIGDNEIMIVAEPYFFSRNNNLSYEWSNDGTGRIESNNAKNKMKIIFDTESPYNFSRINIDIKNNINILQYAKNSFSVSNIKNR